jgi:hypothetical protein
MDRKKLEGKIAAEMKKRFASAMGVYQAQRDKDLDELVSLYSQLEGCQAKLKELVEIETSEKAKYLPDAGVLSRCSSQINYLERNAKDLQRRIDETFEKLIRIPDSAIEMHQILKLMG